MVRKAGKKIARYRIKGIANSDSASRNKSTCPPLAFCYLAKVHIFFIESDKLTSLVLTKTIVILNMHFIELYNRNMIQIQAINYVTEENA